MIELHLAEKLSIQTTQPDGRRVWQARDIPYLTVAGEPVAGKVARTADGFTFRTESPRQLTVTGTVQGNRLLIEITEPAPSGTTLPERMRQAGAAPAVQILPGLFALDVAEKQSGFALPMMEGMWLPSSSVPVQATYKLFYVAGLTMGFWAACRPGRGTVLGLSDHPYLQFQLVGAAQGQRWLPEWLRDPTGQALRLEIVFLEGAHWLDAAKEFRRYELARKKLVPLSRRPAARNLVGGANIKFHNYSRRDGQTERLTNTFAQVAERCRELKAMGVDRALAIFWGWGKEGYDRLHPDFLPANSQAGGDEVLRAASDAIRALGYSAGGHDNYQDIYQVAPSFGNGESVCVTAEGKLQAGGIWTGGQCYIQCSAEALRFAQRNLPEMKQRYGWEALFIDTTTAVHLYECFSDRHPRSRHDDMQDKIALMDYAREMFGVFGSEAGTSWGVEHMDYWEGVLQIPYADAGAKGWIVEIGARPVPIFGAVYRDVLTAYQHQSCSQAANAPLMFLVALRSGQPPYYFFNNDFWEKNAGFVRQSFAVLGHLHRLTVDAVVTGHEWLTADGSVEKTILSDGTEITVNWSTQPYATGEFALPGNGFYVRGPKIVAFHAERVGGTQFTPARWAVVREDGVFSEPATDAAGERQLRALLNPGRPAQTPGT